MGSLYLPGIGTLPLAAVKVHKAVKEYDERLSFRLNERTGQWCVMIAQPHGQEPIPVRGFDSIPDSQDVLKFLYQHDTLRHGTKLLDDIDRNNQRIKDEVRWKATDAAQGMAEHTEFIMRKDGRTEKYTKSFRVKPRG